jgi:hypothetical protein
LGRPEVGFGSRRWEGARRRRLAVDRLGFDNPAGSWAPQKRADVQVGSTAARARGPVFSQSHIHQLTQPTCARSAGRSTPNSSRSSRARRSSARRRAALEAVCPGRRVHAVPTPFLAFASGARFSAGAGARPAREARGVAGSRCASDARAITTSSRRTSLRGRAYLPATRPPRKGRRSRSPPASAMPPAPGTGPCTSTSASGYPARSSSSCPQCSTSRPTRCASTPAPALPVPARRRWAGPCRGLAQRGRCQALATARRRSRRRRRPPPRQPCAAADPEASAAAGPIPTAQLPAVLQLQRHRLGHAGAPACLLPALAALNPARARGQHRRDAGAAGPEGQAHGGHRPRCARARCPSGAPPAAASRCYAARVLQRTRCSSGNGGSARQRPTGA